MEKRTINSITLLTYVKQTVKYYCIASIFAVLCIVFVSPWIRTCCLYVGAVVFLTSIFAPYIDDWIPKKRIKSNGKAILITGCDSGFGHMLAQRLDDLGFTVLAGCLFPDGEGATSLKKSASSRMHILQMDVTSDESISQFMSKVPTILGIRNDTLWAVVNNAGINDGTELNLTDFKVIHRVMDINTFGVVRVTKAVLPLLIKEGVGRVVTVASAAGRYSYPGLVPYCMSKQSAIGFCDGLRLEMYRCGIKVVTIEPWMFKTQITNQENIINYVTRTWENAPPEIKKLYPEQYMEQLKRRALKILTTSIHDKPELVVDCLEEAVMAQNPKYSYNPGTLWSRTTYWFISRLPKPIADFLIVRELKL